MKQRVCLLLAMLLIGTSSAFAEESGFLDSAGKFFGDTWNSVSDAASGAWDTASEAAGGAFDTAGEAIGQAWTDVSGFASDAWSKASVYLGEKSEEFSVWMSISGNDALQKLKEIYDETAAELLMDATSANNLWLASMDYAESNGIAKVTQAKLTLAVLAYAQSADPEGDVAENALNLLLGSGVTDQAAAERTLANLLAANGEVPAAPDPNEPRYYLGEVVNTGKDNGYSGADGIVGGDPHFGWTLGNFFVSGYASVREDESGTPVFIKAPGEQVELWFQLNQDIDCLNGSDALSISEDTNAYDEAFGVGQTNFGRGALIVLRTDDHSAPRTPVLHADFLSDVVSSGANSVVQCFDEGDYEIALDYEIKDQSLVVFSQYSNYRIAFRFSVRNEN